MRIDRHQPARIFLVEDRSSSGAGAQSVTLVVFGDLRSCRRIRNSVTAFRPDSGDNQRFEALLVE